MRAEVKSLRSPDADLNNFIPADPYNVNLFVEVDAGAEGEGGADTFYVTFVTPRALERLIRNEGPLIGRHYVFIERWETSVVLGFIRRAFNSVEGPTWTQISEKLAPIGMWEFEDYQPYAGPGDGSEIP